MKKNFLKRSLVRVLAWPESPFSIVNSSWAMARKSILPTKANPAELAAFRNLSPKQRWEKVKRPEWNDEQLQEERSWSRLLAYISLGCGVLIWVGTGLAFEYLNGIQIAGALAYGGAAFLMFAKKSMWVYALDNHVIILFGEWILMPNKWLT
jgi:hypothetical protein